MENLPENNWYKVSLFPGVEKSSRFIVFLAEGTTTDHMHAFWSKYFGTRFDLSEFVHLPNTDLDELLASLNNVSTGIVITSDLSLFSNPAAYDHIIIAIDYPNKIVQSLLHLQH